MGSTCPLSAVDQVAEDERASPAPSRCWAGSERELGAFSLAAVRKINATGARGPSRRASPESRGRASEPRSVSGVGDGVSGSGPFSSPLGSTHPGHLGCHHIQRQGVFPCITPCGLEPFFSPGKPPSVPIAGPDLFVFVSQTCLPPGHAAALPL